MKPGISKDLMPTQGRIDEINKRSAWSVFKGVVLVALVIFLMVFLLATAMSRWIGH
jgi:hypothetical protein